MSTQRSFAVVRFDQSTNLFGRHEPHDACSVIVRREGDLLLRTRMESERPDQDSNLGPTP
jgi:hypothetical protein